MEALDFIVNVLKEHEKDLDKLINELATVTEQLGDTGEISGKVEKVEEKITGLQKEVASLMNYISGVPRTELPITAKEPKEPMETSHTSSMVPIQTGGPSVIFRCMQWEDFQNLASQAQALSFCYKEDDKTFKLLEEVGDENRRARNKKQQGGPAGFSAGCLPPRRNETVQNIHGTVN